MVSLCRASYSPKQRIKVVEDFFIDLDYARTEVALESTYPLFKILVSFFVSSVQPLEFKGLFTWRWGPQVDVLTRRLSPYLSCKRDNIKAAILSYLDQIKMRDYMDGRVTPPT